MRTWERWLPELALTATIGTATAVSLAVFHYIGIVVWIYSVIWGAAVLASAALPALVRRSGEDWRKERRLIFLAGLVFGVVSIATGLGNNGTDEPYAMGGYLAELLRGQDPYTTQFAATYTVHVLNVWSNVVHTQSYYTYLPLLLFLQIPGTGAVGYEALCLACWIGIVYLVWNDEFAVLALASPAVALVAANGFTDLPVLFLMTLSLRGSTGARSKAVEYLTYGLKQFANVFWLVYYALRKEVVHCALVLAITLLIALPFLLWHPLGIWCEALTFSLGPGCASAPSSMRQVSDLYSHWNYYLWILWVYVLFHRAIDRGARRLGLRLRPSPPLAEAA